MDVFHLVETTMVIFVLVELYDDTVLTPVAITANSQFGGTLTTNLGDVN